MASSSGASRLRSTSPYENSSDTLTYGGVTSSTATNGVMGRRSDFNLGQEDYYDEDDDVIDCLEDDEGATLQRNGTLILDQGYQTTSGYNSQQPNPGKANNRHNGLTSGGRNQYQPLHTTANGDNYGYRHREPDRPRQVGNYSSNGMDGGNDGTLVRDGTEDEESKRGETSQVQKILEKSKANLSRSKSELGEQHRKVLSSIKQGRNEITEQNRRLLANITSGMNRARLFPGMNGFGKQQTASESGKQPGKESNNPAEVTTNNNFSKKVAAPSQEVSACRPEAGGPTKDPSSFNSQPANSSYLPPTSYEPKIEDPLSSYRYGEYRIFLFFIIYYY